MTEAETISTLTEIAGVAWAFQGSWISVTFAYLTVAYFLGTRLSRFQCLVISTLYVYGAFFFAGTAWTWQKAFEVLQAREKTIVDDVISIDVPWPDIGLFLYVSGTLIGLYFMYRVRSDETE